MELSVRAFQPEDAPQLKSLINKALESLSERRGGSEFIDHFRSLQNQNLDEIWQHLGETRREILVGLFDGQVFGLCLVLHEQQILTAEALYVDPEAREVGLGGALLRAAEERARALNCNRLEALALPGDRQMKQVVESGAMKARLLVMSKAL